jgi:predicted GNAT superfamily acetyltransferase
VIPDSNPGAWLDAAWSVARDAASRAGVDVRELHGDDIAIAQEVIGEVWGPQQIPQAALLRAFAHAGCTLLGALVDDRPVGTTWGFLGWTGGMHLHSHMTAVVPAHISGGVGYALKLWQRAVCLREGVGEIRWTYDPLVARNAQFNLVKLGAVVVAMHPNFYGAMDDIVNAGDDSDRFEVSWRLDSPRVLAALGGHPFRPADVVRSHVIPGNYTALSRTDPAAARTARGAARDALLAAERDGLSVEWESGAYRFTRPRPGEGFRAAAGDTHA